jgi:hypothetical protein
MWNTGQGRYSEKIKGVRIGGANSGAKDGSGLWAPGCRLSGVAAAIAAANILALTALAAGATTLVTTGIVQPDVPRCLSIVGNAVGINGNVVITGKNTAGVVITETLVANGVTTVNGTKAFMSIDSILLPAQNAGGNQISVGVTNKLGLCHRLLHNTVVFAFLNNVKEGTPPTVATDPNSVELNLVTLNSALNATVVDIYYMPS